MLTYYASPNVNPALRCGALSKGLFAFWSCCADGHLLLYCLCCLQGHVVVSGAAHSDEMCNLYLMLYGQLPIFMWCMDGSEWVEVSLPALHSTHTLSSCEINDMNTTLV